MGNWASSELERGQNVFKIKLKLSIISFLNFNKSVIFAVNVITDEIYVLVSGAL